MTDDLFTEPDFTPEAFEDEPQPEAMGLELTPESFEDEPVPDPIPQAPVLSNLFCTLCNVRIEDVLTASNVNWKLCDRCYNKAMRKGI